MAWSLNKRQLEDMIHRAIKDFEKQTKEKVVDISIGRINGVDEVTSIQVRTQ